MGENLLPIAIFLANIKPLLKISKKKSSFIILMNSESLIFHWK